MSYHSKVNDGIIYGRIFRFYTTDRSTSMYGNTASFYLLISDATSKEGISNEVESYVVETAKNIESAENQKNVKKDTMPEAVEGSSTGATLSLRKDLYEKPQNRDEVMSNSDILDLPLYSPEQDPSSITNLVENVSPPHDEFKETELLEASSAVPGKLMLPTYIVFILFCGQIILSHNLPISWMRIY